MHFLRSTWSNPMDKLHMNLQLQESEIDRLDSLRRFLLQYFFYLSRRYCKKSRSRSGCPGQTRRPNSFDSRYLASKIPQDRTHMYYFFLCPCQTSQECRGCTKRCRCHAVQTPLDKLRMSCLYPSYRRISLINSPCMLWHSSCKVVSSLVRTENTVTIPQLADTLQARSRHKIVGHSPEPASQASNLCTCHTLSGLGTCPEYIQCMTTSR